VEDYGKCARKGRGGEDEKMEKHWDNIKKCQEGKRGEDGRWKSIGRL
jgi:hypothetical protein